MKILYGIQGTGHGHISRAKELLPQLAKYVSVDVLLSGGNSAMGIEDFVAYIKHGVSLSYDDEGGISFIDTLLKLRPISFIKDVNRISLQHYDLVVSDYEPISAWAAKLKNIPCIALSHQASFLSPNTPRPKQQSRIAEVILQHFAPADRAIGFHFQQYDRFIEPPIIRSPIRKLKATNEDHITVYLSAYHHGALKKFLGPITEVDWHIFSPYCRTPVQHDHIRVYPVSNEPFLDSLASCQGVICNAGFETCAEAMYLGKKLLTIPILRQYEQECNAAALKQMGISVVNNLEENCDNIRYWLEEQKITEIKKIADPHEVVRNILEIGINERKAQVQSTESSDRRVSLDP